MISLIATVLNEGESIHRLMRSLVAQTRPPDELVIVDGGSHDDTVAIIQSYADRLPLRVLVERGCNISAGRNRAIAAASGDIIAAADAGVVLAPDWLEKLTAPLLDNPSVSFSGGFFHAEAHTPFELAMGATVLPLVDEINPATFLPSSRSVAFRKSAWEAVGGYPEWLDYCEDLIFDLRLKAFLSHQLSVANRQPIPSALSTMGSVYAPRPSALTFTFVPNAVVDFRPRGSLRSFFRQYYCYARGDGKANLFLKRHIIRYLTYGVAAPLVLVAGLLFHPLLWLLYIPGAVYYLYQPYRRLRILGRRPENQPLRGSLSTIFYIPLIRIVGDVAKMIGYPVGVVWRLRHHPPEWY
jgi:glycosyltransferase involved in cell wall biosynthesis